MEGVAGLGERAVPVRTAASAEVLAVALAALPGDEIDGSMRI